MVQRATGLTVFLPVLVAALWSSSILGADAQDTVTVDAQPKQKRRLRASKIVDPTKQKRRLRRYRQETFDIPKRVTERRRGSNRNDYKTDEAYPPYLSDFYGYNEETEFPGEAATEYPWGFFYESTEEPRQYLESDPREPTDFPTFQSVHEPMEYEPVYSDPVYSDRPPLPYEYQYGMAHPNEQELPVETDYLEYAGKSKGGKEKGTENRGYKSKGKVSYGSSKSKGNQGYAKAPKGQGAVVKASKGQESVAKAPKVQGSVAKRPTRHGLGQGSVERDPYAIYGGWENNPVDYGEYGAPVVQGCSSKSKSKSKGGYGTIGCVSSKSKAKSKSKSKGGSKSKQSGKRNSGDGT